ncbi:hypothetical protein C8Q80DRAFT_1160477 [Daedaleopsis nitida]|nr:hypothetical protein C8Q80DRAFT_1160477 [Daedaleopsis nitida]
MLLDSRELVCAQFRFVWSLPMLRKLEVWGAREARKTSVLLTRKPFGCANLKTLVLMKCNGAITLPPFAFGESVVDLFVDTRRSLGNILESIQCFRRLESLSFCVRLDGHDHGASPNTSGRPEQDACGSRTETLRAVLQSVRLATGTLHTLKLHVVTSDVHVSSPTNSPYGDERDEFLDALFDKQIVDLFDSFPMLRLLKFTLEENNRLYDPEWWREKIVERLPSRLHPAVMVHIDLEDGSGLYPTQSTFGAEAHGWTCSFSDVMEYYSTAYMHSHRPSLPTQLYSGMKTTCGPAECNITPLQTPPYPSQAWFTADRRVRTGQG